MKEQQMKMTVNDSIATAEQFLSAVRSWAIAQLRELLESISAQRGGNERVTWWQLESIRLLALVHLSNLSGGLEIRDDALEAFKRAWRDAEGNARLP